MLRAFYTVWGLKESYVKAIGVGLYLDLARLRFESKDGKVEMKKEHMHPVLCILCEKKEAKQSKKTNELSPSCWF